jgi:hypothetical protein
VLCSSSIDSDRTLLPCVKPPLLCFISSGPRPSLFSSSSRLSRLPSFFYCKTKPREGKTPATILFSMAPPLHFVPRRSEGTGGCASSSSPSSPNESSRDSPIQRQIRRYPTLTTGENGRFRPLEASPVLSDLIHGSLVMCSFLQTSSPSRSRPRFFLPTLTTGNLRRSSTPVMLRRPPGLRAATIGLPMFSRIPDASFPVLVRPESTD